MRPLSESLDKDLQRGADAASAAMEEKQAALEEKQNALLDSASLAEYSIKGGKDEWAAALSGGKVKGNVSMKSAGGEKKKRRVQHEHDGSKIKSKSKSKKPDKTSKKKQKRSK